MADPSSALAGQPGNRLAALRLWWPGEAADAVRLSLAVVVAIWLSMRFELQEPHWAGWTVLSVTLATRAASLRKSLWRAFSTVAGVTVAMVLVANFAQQTLAFDVAIALWLGLLTAASTIESGQRSYGFALMGFTVPIVAFANVDQPTQIFTTGVDRCSTILLGILCAYAANVPIAPGVPKVARALADRLDATADACATWLATAAKGSDLGAMPSGQISALSEAVIDSFTEQPSLRSGGRAVYEAPSRLRHVLAAGLLRARLPDRSGSRSTVLLGDEDDKAARQIDRVRVAARLLRRGRRIAHRRVSLRPQLLIWNDLDWDGRSACNNGLRAMAAVSVVNGFWYVTGWSAGSDAATWAGVLAVLLASRPDAVAAARTFLMGSVIAVVVGLVARYVALTTTGDFFYLAAILLPVSMMAVSGRADPRAVYGTGYGFLVLGVINPTNAMTYDLSASLNQILAELLGMGFAIIAFAALPPPADAATLRRRAQARLLRSVHAVATDPHCLLVPRERWLARGFGRLAVIVHGSKPHHEAQTLLLTGLLLLALRRADDRLGRMVGGHTWDRIAPAHPSRAADADAALSRLATETGVTPLQAERIATLRALLVDLDLSDWPGSAVAPPRARD